MGNNGFATEADILKLKKAEKSGEGGGGCRIIIVILLGLLFIAIGFYVIFFVEGKPSAIAIVAETPLFVAETAVSTSSTPTLVPTATATASPTATASATATAQPTHTPLPTQTPYPTHTPYPSATWTAQPTFTPQATHTAQPTYTPYPTATPTASATAQPTAAPVATERPFLAPVAFDSDPPGGNAPTWLPWLIGGLFILALTALGVLAYVSRQMRPPTPAPAAAMPAGGGGGTLTPPDWQPVRESRPAPAPAPVTPVSPPEVAPVQAENAAAPPEKIEVSVTAADPSVDETTMRDICAAWNEIVKRGEKPSLNKLCTEYFGGKNSERMAIARRAVKWGRAQGLIANPQQKSANQSEVTNHDTTNRPKPKTKPANKRPRRQPIPFNQRGRRTQLN